MNWDARRLIAGRTFNLVKALLREHNNPNEFIPEIHEAIDWALAEQGWSLYPDAVWRSNYPFLIKSSKVGEPCLKNKENRL